MKTIVVDDDQRNRQAVCEMLHWAGHTTEDYETADEAVVALVDRKAECDLVVTDVNMPGYHDGIDLAMSLQRNRPRLPVIVMSASADELRRAKACGLSGPTLLKPISRDELLDGLGRISRPRRRLSVPTELLSLPDRFADPGRVLTRMFCEAASAGDPHVGTEHLALAALDGPAGLNELAVRMGGQASLLRQSLLACCPHPKVDGEVGVTFRTTRLIAVASQMATIEGSRHVESRHLVRALLTAPRAVAWVGLTMAGLDCATARAVLRDALVAEHPRTTSKALAS